nr:alpha-aminoadipic semialdehyde synthase [Ipomoea batatas]
MLGNGIVGILAESTNKWERRVPLTPSHCARLLHGGKGKTGVARIVVQPSTKRIHHDALYEDVGCELDMILPDRAYAFFSHTHKAQKENMPLLDKILASKASLFDYELIVGDHGKRLLAFGKFAGRAGMIDFLRGLGQWYLNLGYSTPFLSLGSSYMYSSLAAAKAAVISVGEEIATTGLPSGICPLVFVFTGSGNVSHGAQEIFKLLPHTYVDPSKLPELFGTDKDLTPKRPSSKRVFQVYGCVVTCQDMVEHKDPSKSFDKVDYYAHPEHYKPVFHEKIAPYASVIVNCMYWERRYPRLLTTQQFQDLMKNGCRLVGISDISCDIEGSIEFINQTTSIDSPFFRYDPFNNTYHHDMEGNGIICSTVDILPTEFAKEASQHFGDILSQFVRSLASVKNIDELPAPLKRACIVHIGNLTPLYEYIPRMRKSDLEDSPDILNHLPSNKKRYTTLVSLSGHLFDQFLINEALDIIEEAGGSFHLMKCQVGQSSKALSYSEVEVGADDKDVLDKILDSLTSIAYPSEHLGSSNKDKSMISLKVGKVLESSVEKDCSANKKYRVLILGAGRVCRPAVEFLASLGGISAEQQLKSCISDDFEEQNCVEVIVASLYLKDAKEVTESIPNAKAIQLDISDCESLHKYISQLYVTQVDVVVSLLPPSCHSTVASACIELKRNLVTSSYVDDSMSSLSEDAKSTGVTILGEMGLDPGIDHMMAMNIINQAHARNGRIKSFVSYCGGLPSPEAANNPLAYKFSWSPAGALRAGRNPATYRFQGEVVEVEGFSEIMGTLAKLGFFNTETISILEHGKKTTYAEFLHELLRIDSKKLSAPSVGEKDIIDQVMALGHCKTEDTAANTAKTILFLGFHESIEIPVSCKSAFDVTCSRMEERLTYTEGEKDMVLLHHEVVVDFPDGQTETHQATLLEFGRTNDGRTTTAMAITVGLPAAIGALLLLSQKIKATGVLRPTDAEVYVPSIRFKVGREDRVAEKP